MLLDIPPKAIKTGMLFDEKITRTVAETIKTSYLGGVGPEKITAIPPLIVDPVCVSTSGHTLLHQSALRALIENLFPIATLITPNKAEAELLLAAAEALKQGIDLAHSETTLEKYLIELKSLHDVRDATERLVEVANASVLLKGGHLTVTPNEVREFLRTNTSICAEWRESREHNTEILRVGPLEDNEKRELVVDILVEKDTGLTSLYVRPRINSRSTHGTGCTLSAAIASFLARGSIGGSSF